MPSFQSSGGGLEQPMLPSQPPLTNAAAPIKRKMPEDGDPFRATKKLKNDTSTIPAKRKAGEEKIGGFVIQRGPPSRSQSQQAPVRSLSRAPSQDPEANPSGPSTSQRPPSRSKPPSTSRSHDPKLARVRKKGKKKDFSAEGVIEEEVENDVRMMNSEADNLRDRSRTSIANMSPDAMNVDFPISTKKPSSKASSSQQRQGSAVPVTPPSRSQRDRMMPIAEEETPQIDKNREFRGQLPRRASSSSISENGELTGSARRRSSMGMRGKRASSIFDSGIITRPHTSVSDASLYKHIDPDLPESQRIRQLLIWLASRAMEPSSSSSRKGKSPAVQPNPNLPPLPPGGTELLREVEEDILRQLAEKRIDTSAYSEPSESGSTWTLKENEQNVKNRAREKLFTEQIEERKNEEDAWAEVAQFYNAHQANVLASINRHRSRAQSDGKPKGKQRATSQEPDDFDPWENELPDTFRGPKGYDLAKRVLSTGKDGFGKGDPRREELQYNEDRLYAAVSVVRHLTETVASELDYRFALLSLALTQRTIPPNPTSTSNTSTLSNFLPATAQPISTANPSSSSAAAAAQQRTTGPDPQDLLRAISRTDAARPKSQLGDAARRAAKDMQTQVMNVERKLTDVPPPTPRKPPGTPKRTSTPGASRR